MRDRPRPYACILALIAGLCLATASAAESTRILFIGNSYTGQIKNIVAGLFAASPQGKTTEIEFITPAGKTLEFHLNNKSITQTIAEGDWDFVVLQDQSQTPAVFPDRFEKAAIDLNKLIVAAGARTVFYQTWGRRDGDKQNIERFPTYESMQKALSESYIKAATHCDAILAPVGDTWALIRDIDEDLGFALYKGDGSHPSDKGAYLAACVFYASIFRQSPEGVQFTAGIPPAEATLIRQATRKSTGH